jgi:hypothetical protein
MNRKIYWILLIFSFCTAWGFAEGTVSVAANTMYTTLAKQTGVKDFSQMVKGEAQKLNSIEDLIWLYSGLAALQGNLDERCELYKEQASVLERAGRFSEAALAYENASRLGKGQAETRLVISAAICHLFSANTDKARALASGIQSSDQRFYPASRIILGWLNLNDGKKTEALQTARTYFFAPDSSLSLAALTLGLAASDGAEQAEITKLIGERHPGQSLPPQLFLLTAGMIEAKPMPSPLLETPKPEPSPQSTVRYYQLGAFRDKSNAENLAQKIEKQSIKAYIDQRPGQQLFIVYIKTTDNSGAEILALKNAGFEAWLIDMP